MVPSCIEHDLAQDGGVVAAGGGEDEGVPDRILEGQPVPADGLHQRFKDVRQGPDGLLYALTDEDNSVLLRISPAPHQSR